MTDDLALALQMADAADVIAMAAFTGSVLAHETKDDGSPVTETDRAIELALLELVRAERPGDAFVGEEVGAHPGSTGRRWIVDGIDGTIVFVQGGVSWGTQLALEIDGEIVIGVRTNPASVRRWWAALGEGAWTDRDGREADPVRIHVSDRAELATARCSMIPPLPALREDARVVGERLAATSTYVEPEQHCALLVAEGLVDTSYQPFGGPWDFAPLAIIVEEAGGRFGSPTGARTVDEGGPVVYSNGALHEATLAALVQEVNP
jgi:histidinol-phosphatase